MELTVIVGLACTLIGMLIGVLSFARNRDKDLESESARKAVMETKLDAISSGVDSIRIDLKAQEKKWDDMDTRLVRVEESSKSAHKRIDALSDKKREEIYT